MKRNILILLAVGVVATFAQLDIRRGGGSGGSGAAITNLNANQFTTGADGSITIKSAALLTNISGASIGSGTVADARIASTVARDTEVTSATNDLWTAAAAAFQATNAALTQLGGISGVAGDIIYHNGSSWVRLAKGIAGQVLEMNAGATAPEWDTDDSGSTGGGVSDGDKGDITISGTGATYTIDDDSVDGTDISVASEAAGDILYFNGTDWIRLAKGTANQALGMNSGATAPEYKTIQGTSGKVTVTHGANSVTLTLPDDVVIANSISIASSSAGTFYLGSSADTNLGVRYTSPATVTTNFNITQQAAPYNGFVFRTVSSGTNVTESATNTLAGIEANLSGTPNIIASTEIDSESEFEAIVGVDFITPTETDTLSNKTIDESNNVLGWTEYLPFVYPAAVDGVGATITTNNYSSLVSGLAAFSGTGETNANYAWYYVGVVPRNLDTGTAMTLADFNFSVAGTDTDAAQFDIAFYQPSSSGAMYPTSWASASTPIRISSGTLTSPVANDAFFINAQTLTGWAAALTAGRPLIVGVARVNNSNDDAITVQSLNISFKSTR